jgi:hypothetical protein
MLGAKKAVSVVTGMDFHAKLRLRSMHPWQALPKSFSSVSTRITLPSYLLQCHGFHHLLLLFMSCWKPFTPKGYVARTKEIHREPGVATPTSTI